MSPPDISTVVSPQIGTRYMVPCLRMAHGQRRRYMRGLIPIIGDRHEDAEIIGFPHQHWHIDWRFVSARAFEQNMRDRSPYERNVWLLLGSLISDAEGFAVSPSPTPLQRHARGVALITMQSKVMRRAMPTWSGKEPFAKPLAEAYAGRTLKCGICPHKRLDLTSIPAIGGVITCPGHGLRFDAASGQVLEALSENNRTPRKI